MLVATLLDWNSIRDLTAANTAGAIFSFERGGGTLGQPSLCILDLVFTLCVYTISPLPTLTVPFLLLGISGLCINFEYMEEGREK